MDLRSRITAVLAVFFVPSCSLYDSALLEEALGGSGASAGDGDGDTAATGGSSTGGIAGTGAQTSGSGGDSMGTGGEAITGGSGSGHTGGGSGLGGSPPDCSAPSGVKGEIADVGASSLVEDFNTPWSNIASGTVYTGLWYVSRDPVGTGIGQKVEDSHDHDPCALDGDEALHVEGTGYTTWGASFDANLMANVAETDLSAFTGVTFWARSDDVDQIKLGFSDGDTGNGTAPIETPPLLIAARWTQYWVNIPAAVATERMKVLHVVASANEKFDFWLDDLTFYAEP